MAAPAISILLPNYNYARYVGETLESVLKQTYTDFEVIVVDDGSTDNSVEVIEFFVRRDPGRIHLVRKKNGGLSSARNAALRHSRGRMITFLDSDDLWYPGFLAEVADHLERNPRCMAVYANAELFDSKTGRAIGEWFGPLSWRKAVSGHCAAQLMIEGNHIPIDTALVRREVFDSLGDFDEHFRVGEDWDFWLRVTSRYEIDYIDRVLCRIRRHGANLSFYPLNALNRLRIYRKTLALNPAIEAEIGPERMNDLWFNAYYELGRVMTLNGCGHRARQFFARSLSLKRAPFKRPFLMYYPLTYFPWMGAVRLLRKAVVRMRRTVAPKAH